jgi:hypothetical protein
MSAFERGIIELKNNYLKNNGNLKLKQYLQSFLIAMTWRFDRAFTLSSLLISNMPGEIRLSENVYHLLSCCHACAQVLHLKSWKNGQAAA